MTSRLFLDYSKIPPPKGEYVLWCDGMGTSRELNRSLERAASFVLMLHRAFAEVGNVPSIRSYPVMDGLYVTSGSRTDLMNAIKVAFAHFGRDFIKERGTKNMFMMRGGIAYGPVLHGDNIPDEAFADDKLTSDTKRSILLSPAMVLAYLAESKAPPFGIYVDDSAKTYPQLTKTDDRGFISNLYQWWQFDEDATSLARDLYKQIVFYLDKARIHSVGMGYSVERIQAHGRLAEEYFGGIVKVSNGQ